MKVLVVTNMYPTESRPWFGNFVREQVEDLRRLGIDINVLNFDGTRGHSKYFGAMQRLRNFVRNGSHELIHAHYGLSGAVALVQRRLPVVTTFHGSDFTGVIPWQAGVSWIVARLCTPIFVSPEGPRRLGLPDATVIPAGVDTEFFKPSDRAAARRELGWEPEAQYVLFLGARANPLKRVDLFDSAVDKARRSVPELRSISLENFSRREVVKVMNAADVSVLTSDFEGSPVSVRESLACMTPVVAVDVGDLRAVLRRLPGCAIVERDPARLGEHILAALDAKRDRHLRERALKYSRRRIAELVASVYEDVLKKRARCCAGH